MGRAAVRPAMVSGVIPETGWRAGRRCTKLAPLPPVSDHERMAWKLDMSAYAAIASIAENFVRVSPVNLMTGAWPACAADPTATEWQRNSGAVDTAADAAADAGQC